MESKRLKSKQLSSGEAGDNALREIKQLKSAKYQSDIRKELLDGKLFCNLCIINNMELSLNLGDDLTSTLRLRHNKPVGDDMNQASKYYGDIQEKIAEDMLSLTRNLKEQTQTANKIIKRDTVVNVYRVISFCQKI
jgi:unconventional SNARE in the endoplasmic reticulum protein 1